MAFWTYILLCADGRYYTGHTDNLEHRIGQHQSGLIEGFTSSRLPVRLMWSQDFPTRIEALEAEMRIKKWSRAKKEALIRGDWGAVSHFAKPPAERPSSPVRVERSRDTPQDSATFMGVSTSLDTNGIGMMARQVRGEE
ncbi:GIY-YIG nuclease family protein [Sphingopyxis terrae]|jgi:predicted GIY-YIG superfamily endonuclease|uniref:GIY-YIG nuclease family protein n=1 Tax=Sphingopyxis terrae TaxID=33052 RepID=UPI000B1274CA|nr:GIY-YIG nuclease family protein [Sphingopyxis terrae]MDX8357706.1 GIY-YIG nuclease family protein [Sphingopyxis terrae]